MVTKGDHACKPSEDLDLQRHLDKPPWIRQCWLASHGQGSSTQPHSGILHFAALIMGFACSSSYGHSNFREPDIETSPPKLENSYTPSSPTMQHPKVPACTGQKFHFNYHCPAKEDRQEASGRAASSVRRQNRREPRGSVVGFMFSWSLRQLFCIAAKGFT